MKRNFKSIIAVLISAIAMAVAAVSSSMCFFWAYEEVEMPKFLIKKDN
ncbi:MAG: cyclic lactone autoinducer peptide [Clostridium sp.]|nr:cyclic lactone autoinducer peptide [Clostridium sp.]